METGATALAFASEGMAEMNGVAIRPNSARDIAAGIEIALVTEDPEGAFTQAVTNGAAPVKATEVKPWGQKVCRATGILSPWGRMLACSRLPWDDWAGEGVQERPWTVISPGDGGCCLTPLPPQSGRAPRPGLWLAWCCRPALSG